MSAPPPKPGSGNVVARLRDLAPQLLTDLPFGVLVGDGAGRLHAWNRSARRLLGEPARLADDVAAGAVRCCDLFGCRSGEGALADACITELALESGDVLPELRVDLRRDVAAWITASCEDDDRIVFHVRPADPRDRRRRTDPHWATEPRLYIEVLGRTEVHSGETPLGGKWLAQRPGQLLKFMVARRRTPVHTEEIAQALWPEGGLEAPGNVRHHMHGLRRRLEPGRPKRAPSLFLITRAGGYQLDRARVAVDADVFARAAHAGLDAAAAGQHRFARTQLEEAARLYKGDFIADEPYAEWALDERDAMRDLAARALKRLAEIATARADLEASHRHLRRLAELDPLDIDVQRELLVMCLRRGRRTEAARRHRALRLRTMRELGREPDFTLADLADELESPDGRASTY